MPVELVENKAIEEIEKLINELRQKLQDCNCREQVKVVHDWRNYSIWVNHNHHVDYIEIAVFDFPNHCNHLYVVVYGFVDANVIRASGTAEQVIEQLRPDPEELKDAVEGDDVLLDYTASRIVEVLDEYNKKVNHC